MGTRQKQQQQQPQLIFIIPSVRFVQKNYQQPQTISIGWYHTFIDCDLKYQVVSYTLDAAAPAEGYYYYNVLLVFCQSLESNQSFRFL